MNDQEKQVRTSISKDNDNHLYDASSGSTIPRDLEIVNPGSLELDFQDLTVEALEQRLELAIGKVFLPGPPEGCVSSFNCAGGFGCADFVCQPFC